MADEPLRATAELLADPELTYPARLGIAQYVIEELLAHIIRGRPITCRTHVLDRVRDVGLDLPGTPVTLAEVEAWARDEAELVGRARPG